MTPGDASSGGPGHVGFLEQPAHRGFEGPGLVERLEVSVAAAGAAREVEPFTDSAHPVHVACADESAITHLVILTLNAGCESSPRIYEDRYH
jgi:hypothetical protein